MTTTSDPLDRLRDVLRLVARLGADDPAVRRSAEAELADLRERLRDGPSPGEVFGRRVAQLLREQAERLSRDEFHAER